MRIGNFDPHQEKINKLEFIKVKKFVKLFLKNLKKFPLKKNNIKIKRMQLIKMKKNL